MVASIVRCQDESLPSYESIAIQVIVIATALSSVVTWTASLRRVQHWYAFIGLALTTLALALYVLSGPPKAQRHHWETQNECLIQLDGLNLTHLRPLLWGGLLVITCINVFAWGYLFKRADWGRCCYSCSHSLVWTLALIPSRFDFKCSSWI